ncbi:MAG TPA: GNAT family N-acetyltransferase [Ignavibacteriaceae bacterium]
MIITEPISSQDFERYFDLRWRMLREPWKQPRGTEKDELEERALHIMVCQDDRVPVAVGRAHFNTDIEAQIRFMAVEPRFQKTGLGSVVLKRLEDEVRQLGAQYVILHSRDTAVQFYEHHGYKVVSRSHTLFETVPHFLMKKEFYPENKLNIN